MNHWLIALAIYLTFSCLVMYLGFQRSKVAGSSTFEKMTYVGIPWCLVTVSILPILVVLGITAKIIRRIFVLLGGETLWERVMTRD